MTTHIVQSTDYNQASDALRREIAVMLQQVWPDFDSTPKETISETHLKEFNVRSFYSYIDGKLVSYAGVVRKTIHHKGQPFNIARLSCVATDPDYQWNNGLVVDDTETFGFMLAFTGFLSTFLPTKKKATN